MQVVLENIACTSTIIVMCATRIIIHQPHEHPPTTTQVYRQKKQEVKNNVFQPQLWPGSDHSSTGYDPFGLLETWLKVVDVKIYAHLDYCL